VVIRMDKKPKTTKSGAIIGSKPAYEFQKCPGCGKNGYYTPKPWSDEDQHIRYEWPAHCQYCDHKDGPVVCVDTLTDKEYPNLTSMITAREREHEAPEEPEPEPLTKDEKKQKAKELFWK
jgi:rRNA maturation protein Nop10